MQDWPQTISATQSSPHSCQYHHSYAQLNHFLPIHHLLPSPTTLGHVSTDSSAPHPPLQQFLHLPSQLTPSHLPISFLSVNYLVGQLAPCTILSAPL